MIESQYERALELLSANKEKLTELANKLLSQEVIFKEDLELIFGKREWETNTAEETPESKEESAEPKEEEEKKVLTEPIDGVDDQTDASKPKKDIENENELND